MDEAVLDDAIMDTATTREAVLNDAIRRDLVVARSRAPRSSDNKVTLIWRVPPNTMENQISTAQGDK